jgi:small subunit ribosomal protein S16
MVVRLRLSRQGKKHQPFYHVYAADARSPRDGRHLEKVGTFDPRPNKQGVRELRLQESRVKYWLSVGAQCSDRVAWLLGKAGLAPVPPQRFSDKKMVPKAERPGAKGKKPKAAPAAPAAKAPAAAAAAKPAAAAQKKAFSTFSGAQALALIAPMPALSASLRAALAPLLVPRRLL